MVLLVLLLYILVLLVYGNTIGFYILILYPTTSLKSLISSRIFFFCQIFFFVNNHVISKYGQFYFFLSDMCIFYFLAWLGPQYDVKQEWQACCTSCLVFNLKGESSLTPLGIMLAKRSFVDVFYQGLFLPCQEFFKGLFCINSYDHMCFFLDC